MPAAIHTGCLKSMLTTEQSFLLLIVGGFCTAATITDFKWATSHLANLHLYAGNYYICNNHVVKHLTEPTLSLILPKRLIY